MLKGDGKIMYKRKERNVDKIEDRQGRNRD